ncbi:hypothetical protein DQ04_10041000, partial [Trypanosoma grayi]|uniref:hypothetical protein n=1 Tax=Trypanosoma grayi TaxID=71804 RepID=UPI0004F4726E
MEAAPQWGTEAGGQHHGCRCHHNCAAPSASDALRLLGDVDAAIAWCEGKAAVTALLFPPAAHRIHRPRHSSHTEGHDSSNNNNNNSKMKVRGSTPSDEEAYSHWQEPQVMPRRNAPHDYYETPDGNIRSCSSSRSRARQPITSPPTLPCTATRGVDDGGCNLDFDRWTARQIAAQAQHDKRRLWLLRCVAEEAVRRHAVIVEERLGRIALLVTAREEVAAVAGFLETEQWMKQQHNNVCERLLPSTYRPLGEGMTFVEASPPEPQKRHGRKEDDLAPSHRDGDEQKALGISCAAKGVQTFVSGPCVSGVAWSSFTYALLHSSENMQRLHIDKEAQLSWQLLLAQWQSVVNHVN